MLARSYDMKRWTLFFLCLILCGLTFLLSVSAEETPRPDTAATGVPAPLHTPKPETPRPAEEDALPDAPEEEAAPEPTPTPAPKLRITEACADNDFVWTLNFQDYLEIYNAGELAVNLEDFTVRIKKKTVRLPAVSLNPGAYYVLICDGKKIPSLSKSGFTAALIDPDGAEMDSVTVPASKNQVWLRGTGLSYMPSPGYSNGVKGAGAWYEKARGDLIISESLSANFKASTTRQMRGPDVLELFNASDKQIKLSNFYLSDDRKTPKKYQLPNVTLAPGGCYTLLCETPKSDRNTGFKLSSNGELVYLSNAKGKIVDVLNIPPLPLDISYGRQNGAPGYFAQATMGAANTSTLYTKVAQAPTLSVSSSGGHKKAFTVTIQGEGPFYYTTDGSDPTGKSTKYEAPIPIKGSTTLRVVAIPKGSVKSPIVTAVYRFDSAKYTLPCVFISVDRNNMVNKSYGLLNNVQDKNLEVPAHITFLQKNGKTLFDLDCGLSIAGQTSRPRPNRGWKVNFRSKYGQSTVDAQVFDDLDVTSFNSFVFRLGTTGNPMHDILGTAVGAGVMEDVLYQHYRPVNLFIGGEYYGVYYMREHVNENFVANHLGGDADHVDIIYNIKETKAGSNKDWVALMDYCKQNSLAKKEHYDYVAARINVNSFMDYFIWRPYTGDSDHPNIRYVRSRNGQDKRWHIVIYDMDWAFQKKNISLDKYTYKLYEEEKHNNIVIYSLLKNASFRKAFLERLSYHMKHTFAPTRVIGLLDQLNGEIKHDMAFHQARWKSSMSAWNRAIQDIKAFVKAGSYDRRTALLKETQKFFKLTDEQMKEYFGGIKY